MSGAVGHDSALSERYAIERELGRGGMGVVFLARDLRHDRSVAIKFLAPDVTSAVSAARFTREIRTLARLSHPHILPLHDSGEAEGELYCVMAHVEGESLRQRLERKGALRVPNALRIARQVADALAYAHARGVIHRDIKPENILLDHQGHAYVADFGIARVLQASSYGSRLTSIAVRVGSPAYMSPEQVAGDADLDGRSDIYSLGCVLFEMLAGEAPFADANAHVVLRRHLVDPPPSMRKRRADVAPGLSEVVTAMLAKAPDDRFATADALALALDAEIARITGESTAPRLLPRRARRVRRIALTAGAAIMSAAALIWGLSADVTGGGWLGSDAPPDTTQWMVLPLQWQDGSQPSPDRVEDVDLHTAFTRWEDLKLVDRLSVEEAVQRRGGPRAITAGIGLELARLFDAGRYVHGLATRVGDSVHVDVGVSDAAGDGRLLRRVSMRIPRANGAAAYALLADSLLFGRVSWDGPPEVAIGTSSAAARRHYGNSRVALNQWDLPRADSLLVAAIDHDPGFVRARLWLAQTRHWAGHSTASWLELAATALAGEDRLPQRERLLARALVHLGRGSFPDACTAYGQLLERDDRSFAAWYGLGECQTKDSRVVRDASTASGWRFRSSYHRGVDAYRQAFLVEPASHRAFASGGYERILNVILYTRPNRLRQGYDDDGARFVSGIQLQSDSTVFLPLPWPDKAGLPPLPREGRAAALTLHRETFRQIAHGWTAAHARSADAVYAVALSLEMLNDAAALDTLRRARSLATAPAQESQLAIRQVWLRLKLGIPRGDELLATRFLADSLLARGAGKPELATGAQMAALAVLVGRPSLAALHARRDPANVANFYGRGAITRPAAALLAFAAVGGPADSLAALERATDAAIRNTVAADERAEVRKSLLERPALLAFPIHRFSLYSQRDALQSSTARAQAAWLAGDSTEARSRVRALVQNPSTGTMDITYALSAVAAQMGDVGGAVTVLDDALESIPFTELGMLEHVAHAGALVRAMRLRAEIAFSAGDSASARKYARAVIALWGNGEPAVAPIVARMRTISSR
ncbi:MAG TPA: serine/threonine-protein kinase [Longimicrobiales bacterium]|nr:serine/threonine-protein kinase [Longimicrobiales bacterium]